MVQCDNAPERALHLTGEEEMSFKDISYLELCWPFVQRSKTICAILVEGIMRNNSVNLFLIWAIPVKLYEIWTSGSGDVVKKISYLELWRPSFSVEQNN